jgi:hypothetical protein
LPESARLLGSRYRAMFLAYAPGTKPWGEASIAADALAFAEFTLGQRRVALNPPELGVLRREARRLRRRYVLTREGEKVRVTEKGPLRRWLGI